MTEQRLTDEQILMHWSLRSEGGDDRILAFARQIERLSADRGEPVADDLLRHEALDRSRLVAANIGDTLLDHPYIVAHPALRHEVENAMSLIADVYQEIGASHFATDDAAAPSTPQPAPETGVPLLKMLAMLDSCDRTVDVQWVVHHLKRLAAPQPDTVQVPRMMCVSETGEAPCESGCTPERCCNGAYPT